MKKSGAEILLETLHDAGVDAIFGYPGANTLPIHDGLRSGPIRHFLMRHEQAAAHAADGYARATGKVGVCLATSGPGATNLVTGIATAYMDSTPIIALTGQVTTNLLGSDAFQETDIIGITLPITKHSFLVRDVRDMRATIQEAFKLTTCSRPGPVLVDLPRNILAEACATDEERTYQAAPKINNGPGNRNDQLNNIARALNQSERPVIIIGGGVKLSNACREITDLIEKGHIPFVTTMMGVGSVHAANGYNLGFIGTHGFELSNRIVHQADFILAIGTRFSDRSTSIVEEFAPLATIAQIDIDPTSVGKNIKADLPLIGDIRKTLEKLIPLIEAPDRSGWLARIRKERETTDERNCNKGCGAPGRFISMVQEAMPAETTAVTDVGLNQIWTVRSWQPSIPRSLLTSGGMGTMGFSVPAAIGAKVGVPDRDVVAFSGDGGFFMNIQELATISYYQIPIKIVVFNNSHLGMIRQIQDLFYGNRLSSCELGNHADIVAIAKGFGLNADRVAVETPEEGISKMASSTGPYLLEVTVDPENYVYPIIPPGRSNLEMIFGRSD
ncbi:MAG: biosynthetic-type acetolactate synthase large subunit [Deltaproteobacteria bacterium]|nr:biosynthetic-type acetolactate synthase large subunit [Deltaproteobacteria bacterium]